MELSNQLPGSHPLTAPVHPLERITGPPELHHSEGRYRSAHPQAAQRQLPALDPGAPPARGSGPLRRGDGGLRVRRLYLIRTVPLKPQIAAA